MPMDTTQKTAALHFLGQLQQEYIRYGGVTPLGLRYRYHQKLAPSREAFEKVRSQMRGKGYSDQLASYDDFLKELEPVRQDYSRHEDIFNISMLESLKKDLRRAFEFSRMAFPEQVVIGTAQTGQFNAMATKPAAGSEVRVVLMDDGLFVFLNGLSKVVSMLFEKRAEGNDLFSLSFHPDDIDRALAANTFAHEKFTDLLTAYFITGHSAGSKAFTPEHEHNLFAATLRETAELFILAHEYGHIVCGHLSGSPDQEQTVADELKIETWQISWAKEFQADQFACMMVIRFNHHLEDMTATLSFAGIRFLFAALEMLSIAKGYQPLLTHPAPGQRMSRMVDSLYADTPDKALVDEMQQFGKSILYVVHRLWELNRQTIQSRIDAARV